MPKKHARGAIRPPKALPPDNRRLSFSFQYLQKDHSKFNCAKCSGEFFRCLFESIHRYSSFTLDQFKDLNNSERRHQIDFSTTTEKDGFPIDPTVTEIWTDEAWQFALIMDNGLCHSKWRVYGFIIKDVFYVVWLDSDHRLSVSSLKKKKSN
jgi:hypothetical protein